jgi:hypothetical protein
MQIATLIGFIYLLPAALCLLLMERRSVIDILRRKARQRPEVVGMAGVFGQDVAVVMYSFYIRSVSPVAWLWLCRLIVAYAAFAIAGLSNSSINLRENHWLSVPLFFAATFSAMHISASRAKSYARRVITSDFGEQAGRS